MTHNAVSIIAIAAVLGGVAFAPALALRRFVLEPTRHAAAERHDALRDSLEDARRDALDTVRAAHDDLVALYGTLPIHDEDRARLVRLEGRILADRERAIETVVHAARP